jgi:hypothetical protein
VPHRDSNDIAKSIEHLSEAIDKLTADESVQAMQKPLLQRLPCGVRSGIYGAGKWLGLVGAAGLAVAGIVGGEPERYIESGGLLVLAVSNWIAKANLSA